MYDLNNFCNIVSLLRREKGWSQAEFADRLGISPQSISKWECGVGFPDVTLFPTIAETLSVPIGVLFGEKIETEERMDMEDKQNSQNNQSGRIPFDRLRWGFENISFKDIISSDQYEAGYTEEFEVCDTISVRCGNVCRIEVISGIMEERHSMEEGHSMEERHSMEEKHSNEASCHSGKGLVRVVGDPVFLHYFALEHISGQREPDGLLINIKNPTGSAFSWNSYDRLGYSGENLVQIFTGAPITDVGVNVYNYLDLNVVQNINSQGNLEFVYYADDDKKGDALPEQLKTSNR